MLSLNDVELDRTYDDQYDSPPPPPSRIGWLIGVVAALAIAGGIGYYLLTQRAAAPLSTAITQPQRAIDQAPQQTQPQPETPALVGENISLPPLAQTDVLVRELVGRLSSHASAAAWLATKGLIGNFAVVTLNISEGKTPVTHIRALTPRGKFLTKGPGSALTLDPRSYDRYNAYADAVAGLDATGTARLYLTLKPRVLDAYRDLGYPDGDFDRVLERAIGELLRVPIVEGTIALRPKTLSYGFADPRLESLSPAQKQLLRMGPRNVQLVQAKLREIASLLSLHPENSSGQRISSR